MFKLYYLAHFKVAYKIIKHHSILINIKGCTPETTDPTPFLVILNYSLKPVKLRPSCKHWMDSVMKTWTTKAEEGLPTSDFRLLTSDLRLPTSDFRLKTSYFKLQTSNLTNSNSGFLISDLETQCCIFRLLTSRFPLLTSHFPLLTSDFRLSISDFRLPISNFRLPTSNFLLLTSHFRLDSSVRLDCRSIRHAGINAQGQS